jgi:hypothetical protein
VVPCTQLGRTGGTAVQFIAGAVPGDAMGYLASPVAWGTDTQTNGDPTAWEAPDGIATISLDTSAKLRFVGADQLYCITAVSADVRPVGTNETGVPLPAVHQAPASSIDLAPPGIGTWQIRVKVEFPTASGTTWTVETFEVDVQAPIGSPAG